MNTSDIAAASSYVDLFGPSISDVTELETAFRALVKVAHPDGGGADDLFIKVKEMYERALVFLTQGRYGLDYLAEFESSGESYRAQRLVISNPLWDLFVAENSSGALGLVKVASGPDGSKALTREFQAFKHDIDSAFLPYLKETFLVGDRRVNAFRVDAGAANLTSLHRVMQCYPDGISVADSLWIIRRVLVALSLIHAEDVVYAGVTPNGVLIDPADHGVVLVDWAQATNTVISSASPGFKSWYPPEVFDKAPAKLGVDLYMAAKLFEWLSGGMSEPFRNFVRGCTMTPSSRPASAKEMLEDLDNLLARIGDPYWPRRFREFPPLG